MAFINLFSSTEDDVTNKIAIYFEISNKDQGSPSYWGKKKKKNQGLLRTF